MARLGNDSLCLLLVAIAWALMLRMLSARRGRWDAAWLGVVLGLGLLTKAFFLAIAAGIVVLLALRWLAHIPAKACPRLDRGWVPVRRQGYAPKSPGSRSRARDFLLCAGPAIVIGAAWYVRNALSFEDVLAGNDAIHLAEAGGLWSGLRAHASLAAVLRGLAVIPATFAWAGTWSLVRLPEPMLAVPLMLVGCGVVGWLARLRKTSLAADPVVWLPAFFVVPMLVGLLAHVCVTIALYGRSVTPGWYLHVLAVPLGFTVAVGWRWPALMRWLAAASVLVGACGWVLQLSLFSGCAIKTADKHYDLSAAGCLVDWHQLGVLAMPSTGLVAIVAGAAAALAAIAAAISSPPPAPPARAAPASH